MCSISRSVIYYFCCYYDCYPRCVLLNTVEDLVEAQPCIAQNCETRLLRFLFYVHLTAYECFFCGFLFKERNCITLKWPAG